MEEVEFKLSPGCGPPPEAKKYKGSGETQVGVQIQTVYKSY